MKRPLSSITPSVPLLLGTLWLACGLAACDGSPTKKDEPIVRVQSGLTGYKFGVTNQSPYEANWMVNLGYSNENCNELGNRFAENNTWSWWYNLDGGQPWLENTLDQEEGGSDSVHVLYSYTHGLNTWGGSAGLAMYNQNVWAQSDSMRLGDENVGLALWFSWACYTLRASDGNLIDRWANAFAGGLYMLMGSHDLVWDGWTTSDTGEQVAENLNDGDLIYWAWVDGMGDCG